MIAVMIDTNVVPDVLLDRQPHAKHSVALWTHVESGRMRGFLSAHAITTIHYLLRRELGESRATKVVASLLAVFSVAPVDDKVLAEALVSGSPDFVSGSPDFEDAVMAAAARRVHCNFIVTRGPKGFKGSIVKAIPPETANALITS